MASKWCQQRCYKKTCNSRRFPDVYGSFNKKKIYCHHSKCCALNAHVVKSTMYLDLFLSFVAGNVSTVENLCLNQENGKMLHTAKSQRLA